MHISLDQNADTSDAIEFDLLIFVISPITHLSHISAASIVLFVAFCKYCVLAQAGSKSSAFVRLDPGIVVEAPFNVSTVLVSVEPDICSLVSSLFSTQKVWEHTRHNHISIMRHEVLQDLLRAVHNIHIPPVDPRMLRFQRSIKQVIPRPSDGFPPGSLRSEPVSGLDIHRQIRLAKVLLHDRRTMEGNFVCPRLYPIQLAREHSKCFVGRVTDEECQVDQIVRVCEVGEEIEVLAKIEGCISERGEDEDALLIADGARGGYDRVEVDARDRAGIHHVWLVVVEQHWCLQVLAP